VGRSRRARDPSFRGVRGRPPPGVVFRGPTPLPEGQSTARPADRGPRTRSAGTSAGNRGPRRARPGRVGTGGPHARKPSASGISRGSAHRFPVHSRVGQRPGAAGKQDGRARLLPRKWNDHGHDRGGHGRFRAGDHATAAPQAPRWLRSDRACMRPAQCWAEPHLGEAESARAVPRFLPGGTPGK